MNTRSGLKYIVGAVVAAAALIAAGCGAYDPGITHHDAIRTEFDLTITDIHDAPVAGAQAHCKIFLHQRLIRDTTVASASNGACSIALPIIPDTDAIVHRTFATSLKYTVTAPGFVPVSGEVDHGIPLYSSDAHPDVHSTSASQSVTLYTELDYVDAGYAASLDAAGKTSVSMLIDSVEATPTQVEVALVPHGLRIGKGTDTDTLCGMFTSKKVFNSDKLTPRDIARAYFVDGYLTLLPAFLAYADAQPNATVYHAKVTCEARSFDDRASDPHTLVIDYLIPSVPSHLFLAKKLGEEEFLKALSVTVDGAAVALESR